MKESQIDNPSPSKPTLQEDIRRGWDWVVFVVKTLSRIGGVGAWWRSLKLATGILSARTAAQYRPETHKAQPEVKTSFFPASQFPFTAELENNWQTIYRELENLHGEHFIDWSERYLYKDGWTTFGFFGFGLKIEKNCNLCPETTKLLEKIPNLVTAGFSSLRAGTRIAPHTGYPDGVLRCHLGLMVPETGCGIRVGDEIRHWQQGKCLVFDDTLDHEAWNDSDRTRIILLLDFKP